MIEPLLRAAAEKALDYGRRAGAEVEAYAVHHRELEVEVVNLETETLKEAADIGLGIRVLHAGRMGFAFTSSLTNQAIQEAVSDAVQITALMQPGDGYSFVPPGLQYPKQVIFDRDIDSHSIADKIDLVCQTERAARASDPRIAVIERSGYHQHVFSVLIMNSQGLNVFDTGNHCGLYVFTVAQEEGDHQSGFASMTRRSYHEMNPEQIGAEAARRAVRGLQATSIASDHLPCVLEPYVAVRFLGLLARMVDAEAVQKGRSSFADHLHKAVAFSEFSVVDDATRAGGIATFPFDDEGTPAQSHMIIENGVLCGLLYDCYTAGKAGLDSTGNARRGSYRSLPVISPNNFTILGGQQDPQCMVAEIKRGLYITEVLGMHTANPVSGDFSLGAAGLLIEDGVITRPVRGIVVAGNMLELLQQLDGVANDLRYFGSRGSPTLRVAHMSIAGA